MHLQEIVYISIFFPTIYVFLTNSSFIISKFINNSAFKIQN